MNKTKLSKTTLSISKGICPIKHRFGFDYSQYSSCKHCIMYISCKDAHELIKEMGIYDLITNGKN